MAEEHIGNVSHFYGKLGVLTLDTSLPIQKGQSIRVKGKTTDFETTINSMQYDHEEIDQAQQGMSIGIQVPYKARAGDEVFLIN